MTSSEHKLATASKTLYPWRLPWPESKQKRTALRRRMALSMRGRGRACKVGLAECRNSGLRDAVDRKSSRPNSLPKVRVGRRVGEQRAGWQRRRGCMECASPWGKAGAVDVEHENHRGRDHAHAEAECEASTVGHKLHRIEERGTSCPPETQTGNRVDDEARMEDPVVNAEAESGALGRRQTPSTKCESTSPAEPCAAKTTAKGPP